MTLVLTPTCSEPTINQQTTLTVEQIDRDRSTPQMEDLNITREKRRQLRRLLINSQPLISDDTARESRSDGSPLSNDERKTYHADLDEAVRWNLFLTHTDLNLPEVVDFVSYVHNVNEDEHQCALAKAVECHESFKKTTLSILLSLTGLDIIFERAKIRSERRGNKGVPLEEPFIHRNMTVLINETMARLVGTFSVCVSIRGQWAPLLRAEAMFADWKSR